MNERIHQASRATRFRGTLPLPPSLVFALAWGLATSTACDERSSAYGTADFGDPVGLQGSVAIQDRDVDRIAFLTASAPPTSDSDEASVQATFFETRKGARAPIPSLDRQRLYLLSNGDSTRVNDDDERPALSVFSGGAEPALLGVIELDTAFDTITQDPEGRWLVLSQPSGEGVSNPNEFTLVDVGDDNLARSEPEVRNLTIRSFGSVPKRFTFTDVLDVPGGAPRRFLAIETDFDLALVDLDNPSRGEVTIQLPISEATNKISRPAQVSCFGGAADADYDGLLAVRFEDSNSILLVGFTEVADKPFGVTLNLVNVGGLATDLDFVETDGGRRLAALVASRRQAVLVDLDSTVTTEVPLPGALTTMRVVTQDVFDADTLGDVALLWNEDQAQNIAFWSLGETADRAFRSVENTNVAVQVRQVIDIPGSEFAQRKLLETETQDFYILDLATRTSYPMTSSDQGLLLSVTRDGTKAVAFSPGNDWFSTIALGDLHPERVSVERGLAGVFDIEAANGEGALVAVHRSLGISATLFATDAADSVESRHFTGLLLPELPLEEDEEGELGDAEEDVQ